jgi:hypothetical protein
MAKQKRSAKSGMTIAWRETHFNYFKTLLKPVNKVKPYAYIMRVDNESYGRAAYVCTDGRRIHVLRTSEKFGFFEPGNNYAFSVTSKALTFEEAESQDFPNWRRAVPEDTRRLAKAEISAKTRSQYLIGLYSAGIFIDALFLADLEILPSIYSVHTGSMSMGEAITLKMAGTSYGFEFEAVTMPLTKADTAVVLEAAPRGSD